MSWLPRSSHPLRNSNGIRRGRYNTRLHEEGAAVLVTNDNPPPGGGSAPGLVPLADLFAEVEAYQLAHPTEFSTHCSDWTYLDGLVAHLVTIDARVGFCWRPDRNDFSQDALTYYHGALPPVEDSHDVYTVDVIINKCAPDARSSWTDVSSPAVMRSWRSTR